MARDDGGKFSFVQVALDKITKRVYKDVYNEAKIMARWWKEFFEEKFDEPKSGNWTRKPDGTPHQASAVGEYPARYTGRWLEELLITVGTYNPANRFVRINIFAPTPYTSDLIEMNRLLIKESREDFWEKFEFDLDQDKGKRFRLS